MLRKRSKDGRVLELIEMWRHAGILDGKERGARTKAARKGRCARRC